MARFVYLTITTVKLLFILVLRNRVINTKITVRVKTVWVRVICTSVAVHLYSTTTITVAHCFL